MLDSIEEYSKGEDFSYLYYDRECDMKAQINGSISGVTRNSKQEEKKK